MDDKNFYDFINEDVPLNHNIQKYMMVTRNKLRENVWQYCYAYFVDYFTLLKLVIRQYRKLFTNY